MAAGSVSQTGEEKGVSRGQSDGESWGNENRTVGYMYTACKAVKLGLLGG